MKRHVLIFGIVGGLLIATLQFTDGKINGSRRAPILVDFVKEKR